MANRPRPRAARRARAAGAASAARGAQPLAAGAGAAPRLLAPPRRRCARETTHARPVLRRTTRRGRGRTSRPRAEPCRPDICIASSAPSDARPGAAGRAPPARSQWLPSRLDTRCPRAGRPFVGGLCQAEDGPRGGPPPATAGGAAPCWPPAGRRPPPRAAAAMLSFGFAQRRLRCRARLPAKRRGEAESLLLGWSCPGLVPPCFERGRRAARAPYAIKPWTLSQLDLQIHRPLPTTLGLGRPCHPSRVSARARINVRVCAFGVDSLCWQCAPMPAQAPEPVLRPHPRGRALHAMRVASCSVKHVLIQCARPMEGQSCVAQKQRRTPGWFGIGGGCLAAAAFGPFSEANRHGVLAGRVRGRRCGGAPRADVRGPEDARRGEDGPTGPLRTAGPPGVGKAPGRGKRRPAGAQRRPRAC